MKLIGDLMSKDKELKSIFIEYARNICKIL